MTARCSGGTSSARDIYGRFVYMGPAQLGALLNNVPTPWAVVFAGAIGSRTYDLQTFCTTDPPADPGMTTLDWISLINPGTLSASVIARSKFSDWIGHYIWDTLCQCDSGLVPIPFPAPPRPSDLPQVNDPAVGPAYPTGTACQVLTADWQVTAPSSSTPGPGATTPITAGATSVTLSVAPSRPMVTADTTGYQVIFNCFNSAGAFISNPAFYADSSSGPSGTLTASLPAGTASVRLIISVFHVNADVEVSATASVYCGNSSNPGVPQPCPADPFTQMQLDQLLQLVTLIQRQAAPFSYVAGSSHTGLSGHGSIAVQGLLGMKLTVTDDGLVYSVETGDPDVLWNAGWVNWGNADGVTERQWISSSPFLTMPALAGQFTSFHYSLRPGVAIDATEISREP